MPEKPNVSRRGFFLKATSAGVAAGVLAADRDETIRARPVEDAGKPSR